MLLQVPEQRLAVEAEIQAHSMVQHRNVLPLICSEIQENRNGTFTAFLLFPYHRVSDLPSYVAVGFIIILSQSGTLQDLIEQCQRSGQPLPELRVLQLMISLCRGLHAMHISSLAHRDVKV